ncbi:MAG: TIGR02117 family protein [Planctomycetota bacterium]
MTRRLLSGAWRWLRRGVVAVFAFLVFYAAFLLAGLVPLNRGFTPADQGVAIYLASSSVHADLVLPIKCGDRDWGERFPPSDFAGDVSGATHVAIGWGDRGFYLDTPTWQDLKTSTALKAMFLPSGCVLHVACTREPAVGETVQRVVITQEQYDRLCGSIDRSVVRGGSGRAAPLAGEAFTEYDAFYEARGVYHCFNTCNSWVGRRLADAGIATPLFTPLPHAPGWYLPSGEP